MKCKYCNYGLDICWEDVEDYRPAGYDELQDGALISQDGICHDCGQVYRRIYKAVLVNMSDGASWDELTEVGNKEMK